MTVFSEIDPNNYVFESNLFYAVYDRFPVSKGHMLLISKQEKKDFFELDLDERRELQELIIKSKGILDNEYSPDGYNIGMNCGEAAGQTVMHFHCHIIPRYEGDMKDPRGGVRHCIEGKGYY